MPAKKPVVDVERALALLREHATPHDMANLKRFGIEARNAMGVSMANIQKIAKQLGRNHALAEALWKSGEYEARLLTAFVDEPALVTAKQMDRWCRDFDDWGVCDTLCFKLFDQTPHAWAKVDEWCVVEEEFVKRAGFALLASLAGHDRSAGDAEFLRGLALIERYGDDDRNFVKKGVSWALRRVWSRGPVVRKEAEAAAKRMAAAKGAGARWVGKDAVREFARKPK